MRENDGAFIFIKSTFPFLCIHALSSALLLRRGDPILTSYFATRTMTMPDAQVILEGIIFHDFGFLN